MEKKAGLQRAFLTLCMWSLHHMAPLSCSTPQLPPAELGALPIPFSMPRASILWTRKAQHSRDSANVDSAWSYETWDLFQVNMEPGVRYTTHREKTMLSVHSSPSFLRAAPKTRIGEVSFFFSSGQVLCSFPSTKEWTILLILLLSNYSFATEK